LLEPLPSTLILPNGSRKSQHHAVAPGAIRQPLRKDRPGFPAVRLRTPRIGGFPTHPRKGMTSCDDFTVPERVATVHEPRRGGRRGLPGRCKNGTRRFSLSFHPFPNLVPCVEEQAEVSVLHGEPVESEQFLIRVRQPSGLPASGGLRDPEVRVNGLPGPTLDGAKPPQKFCGGDDDETGRVFREGWKDESPKIRG